ncbi:MAG: HesB/IscA family protein [Rickettsiaceae bacterium]
MSKKQEKKQLLHVTDKAITYIRSLLNSLNEPAIGIKIGVKTGGCSGLSYYIEYTNKQDKYDEIVECDDIKILIDPKALMYLIGSTINYNDEDDFQSGLTFENPNQRNSCGCGKSFNV